jgi:hypothetical protein
VTRVEAFRFVLAETWRLVRTHPYLLACSPLLFPSSVFRDQRHSAVECSASRSRCFVHREST